MKKATTLNGLIDLGGIVKPIVYGGLAVGAFFVAKKALAAYQERQGEKNLDTPEGQIAMQLKNVFDSTIVSDEDFRQVYLQVNSSNKDEVFKQYRLLTQRNLTDDIGSHISKDTLTKAVKTEAINSKKEGLIKINSNDDINFLVGKGSKVKLTDSKKSITFYPFTEGLIWDLTVNELRKPIPAHQKIKLTIKGGTAVLDVKAVKLLPYDGAKFVKDWTKYFRPVVQTRKVFALVQVLMKNNKGETKALWADAREFSTESTLKGIDADFKCIGDLVF